MAYYTPAPPEDSSGIYLEHSAKGSTWKRHKYISKKNGRYVYPKAASSTKQKRKGINERRRERDYDDERNKLVNESTRRRFQEGKKTRQNKYGIYDERAQLAKNIAAVPGQTASYLTDVARQKVNNAKDKIDETVSRIDSAWYDAKTELRKIPNKRGSGASSSKANTSAMRSAEQNRYDNKSRVDADQLRKVEESRKKKKKSLY